jgi:hypothetical protein
MKKTLSKEMQVKEAALWDRMKEAALRSPAKVCHK